VHLKEIFNGSDPSKLGLGLNREIEIDLENAEHKDKDTNASMSWYVGIDFVVKLSSK